MKIRNLAPQFLWVFISILSSCSTKEEVKPKPIPDFTYTMDREYAPSIVEFTNKSENASAFLWEFGDDIATSTEENPVYVYNNSGTYTVKLSVKGEGGTEEISKTLTIREPNAEELLIGTWRISGEDLLVNNFPTFRMTFSTDKTFLFSVTGLASNPAYNSCKENVGNWSLSSDNTTITLTSGGYTSDLTVVGGEITKENFTIVWVIPHSDDEDLGITAPGCGDATTPVKIYKLVRE